MFHRRMYAGTRNQGGLYAAMHVQRGNGRHAIVPEQENGADVANREVIAMISHNVTWHDTSSQSEGAKTPPEAMTKRNSALPNWACPRYREEFRG